MTPADVGPVAGEQDTTDPLTEAIRAALGEVLWNASNYPRKAQPFMLGQETAPLRDKATDAVAAVVRASGTTGSGSDLRGAGLIALGAYLAGGPVTGLRAFMESLPVVPGVTPGNPTREDVARTLAAHDDDLYGEARHLEPDEWGRYLTAADAVLALFPSPAPPQP